MNRLGEKLNTLRKAKKLSRYQIEKDTGIDNSYLMKIERGTSSCSNKVLKTLAHLYGAEYEQLYLWKLSDEILRRYPPEAIKMAYEGIRVAE